jgi:hypothetical protein
MATSTLQMPVAGKELPTKWVEPKKQTYREVFFFQI